MTDLSEELVRSDYGFAIVGPVLVQLWVRETPTEGAEEALGLATMLGASGFARTGTLIVVEERCVLPDREGRKHLAAMPTRLGANPALALASEGKGFRASAVRAVSTSISLLAPTPFRMEVFADAGSASSWICDQLPGPVQAQDLMRVTQTLRARVG